ncbi:MAG TPA: hypothetical protein VK002_04525 [Rubricoccaceae bacterium]|nr:hypothetical protein [Rubricoccaceae bacterium]
MARPSTLVKGTAAVVGAAAVTGLALLLWRRWDLPARMEERGRPPAVPPRRSSERG